MSCSLIAGQLIEKGEKARSWLAWQIPIISQALVLIVVNFEVLL